MYYGTTYEISDSELIYKSAPLNGSIKIANIKEIEVGNTLWTSTKPTTALNGLIITHEKS